MVLNVQVKRKQFTDKKTGEIREYFEYVTERQGESVKLKLDKEKNELFKYLIGKCDIPLEQDDRKDELIRKLMGGEALSDEEKKELKAILDDEED